MTPKKREGPVQAAGGGAGVGPPRPQPPHWLFRLLAKNRMSLFAVVVLLLFGWLRRRR